MTLETSLVFYFVVGLGVALAVYVGGPARGVGERWFQVATATVFWPLYVPLLLARPTAAERKAEDKHPADELTAAIVQVDMELEAALRSLDGWAEDVLAREQNRLHELRSAWTAQAERIREMDRLLGRPENAEASGPEDAPHDRVWSSQQARRQNIERLKLVRQRTYQDLMGTLAWVRELVSMIHLAKFTGAPASRAEELVAQVAAAVEGLSALTWQDEPLAVAAGST